MFLILAKMVESDIQRFAGGPGPLGRKKSQEQCQGRTSKYMDGIAFISQQHALKSQQGVKPTVKLSAMELV